MGKEIREAIRRIQAKIGTEIQTHDELVNGFINEVVLPFLKEKIGLLAYVKLERPIKRGRYDARVGSLVIEIEKPGDGIKKGIEQVKGYIREFRDKGEIVRCLVTDGVVAAFVDENEVVGDIKPLEDLAYELQAQLSVLAKMPAAPEDLLTVIGPSSEICMSHIRILLGAYKSHKAIPFVDECFRLWKAVYGAAANLTADVVRAVKRYAKGMDIELKTKKDVEEFLFVVETYLSILMKLLMAGVATQRGLVKAPKLSELLKPPLEAFEALDQRIPFLRKAFEHDAFSWFVDAAREDASAARDLGGLIRDLSLAVDAMDLSKVRIDLLRRVYQEFFDPETRKALGEFYTNEEIVKEVLDKVGYKGKDILDKLLLDPACGSGTFLIIAIRRFIEEAKKAKLERTEILRRVTKQVVGIDIHPFAVAMARVNYLLALSDMIDASVRETLGELTIPIYWTDSLAGFTREPKVYTAPIVEIDVAPLGRFQLPEPEEVPLEKVLEAIKRALDHKWSKERYLQEFSEDIRLKYESILSELYTNFAKRAEEGRDSRWLPTLRNVVIVDQLRENCDFVVGNPPWVRVHNVYKELRDRIEKTFNFYGKEASWNPKFLKARIPFRRQVDYSLAFVEAALSYLKPRGTFGFVITSNVIRSLYAGKMRETLLTQTTLLSIVDYSLSRVQLFERAQNAPLILIFRKEKPPDGHKVQVEMINRLEERKKWEVEQENLPLKKGDPASPWLMAPPNIIKAMRKMQEGSDRLGDIVSVNMGVKTAANDIFFIKDFQPTDTPNVVLAETEGGDKVRIEIELLRPQVRGKDIDAWTYKVEDYIIWTHDDETGDVLTNLPPLALRYFENKRDRLQSRDDYKKGQPIWIIFRVSKEKLKEKVAWQELSKTIGAVYLPAYHKDERIGIKKLIANQTVYFVKGEELGIALAGLLNSTPVRTYTASYVTRTGAAYCHFIAWVIGLIPVPEKVVGLHAKELEEISRRLHKVKGQDEELLEKLDEESAKLYGLSMEELSAMKEFLEFFVAG